MLSPLVPNISLRTWCCDCFLIALLLLAKYLWSLAYLEVQTWYVQERHKTRTSLHLLFNVYSHLIVFGHVKHYEKNVSQVLFLCALSCQRQRRHQRVKTWTRHVDIFKKDFLFVPVNQEWVEYMKRLYCTGCFWCDTLFISNVSVVCLGLIGI